LISPSAIELFGLGPATTRWLEENSKSHRQCSGQSHSSLSKIGATDGGQAVSRAGHAVEEVEILFSDEMPFETWNLERGIP